MSNANMITYCKEKTALTRVRLHLICSLTMNRIASELLRSRHGLSSITEILFNPLRRKIVCRYLRRTERVSMIKIYFKEGAETRSMLMGGVTLWKIFPLFPDKISYPMHYGSWAERGGTQLRIYSCTVPFGCNSGVLLPLCYILIINNMLIRYNSQKKY